MPLPHKLMALALSSWGESVMPPLVGLKDSRAIWRIRTTSRVIWTIICLCSMARMTFRMLCKKNILTEGDAAFTFLTHFFVVIRPIIIPFALLPFAFVLLQHFAVMETTPITNRWRLVSLSPREKQELSALAGSHNLPSYNPLALVASSENKLAFSVFERLKDALLAVNAKSRTKIALTPADKSELGMILLIVHDRTISNACVYGTCISSGTIVLFSGLFDSLRAQEGHTPQGDVIDTTEDVLAFILAHEIAHLALQHRFEAVSSSITIPQTTAFMFDFFRVAFAPLFILAGPFLGDGLKALGDTGVVEISNYKTVLMSQRLELEADSVALRLVEAAGYERSAAVRYLERQLVTEGRGETPPLQDLAFFQHPATEKRIKALKRQLR